MEYSVRHHGEPYEDVLRGITQRERSVAEFAWAEKIVNAAFEEINADIGYGLSYAGEQPAARPYIAGRRFDNRVLSAFDERPA